jgi:BirA family transcriptional regulator, biotin operon repressor / biotin---[acetyl-CoA-carboxylase] ligase
VPRLYDLEETIISRMRQRELLSLKEIRPLCFHSLYSTQDYLSRELKSIHEGDIVFAAMQTAGKGRENRKWFSDEGGLWFSIALKPDPEHLGRIALMFAHAIQSTLELDYALGDCSVKPPNDVYCNGRKIAGVLVDSQIKGSESIAFVGVGIDLNNEPAVHEEIRDTSTSYFVQTGKEVDVCDFLVSLIARFDRSYSALKVSGNREN